MAGGGLEIAVEVGFAEHFFSSCDFFRKKRVFRIDGGFNYYHRFHFFKAAPFGYLLFCRHIVKLNNSFN